MYKSPKYHLTTKKTPKKEKGIKKTNSKKHKPVSNSSKYTLELNKW